MWELFLPHSVYRVMAWGHADLNLVSPLDYVQRSYSSQLDWLKLLPLSTGRLLIEMCENFTQI